MMPGQHLESGENLSRHQSCVALFCLVYEDRSCLRSHSICPHHHQHLMKRRKKILKPNRSREILSNFFNSFDFPHHTIRHFLLSTCVDSITQSSLTSTPQHIVARSLAKISKNSGVDRDILHACRQQQTFFCSFLFFSISFPVGLECSRLWNSTCATTKSALSASAASHFHDTAGNNSNFFQIPSLSSFSIPKQHRIAAAEVEPSETHCCCCLVSL